LLIVNHTIALPSHLFLNKNSSSQNIHHLKSSIRKKKRERKNESEMLQSIRNLTAHFHISKPSLSLHRLFTTTSPKARKDDSRYPDEESRKAAYGAQSLLHRTRYHSDPAFRAAKLKYSKERHANLLKHNDLGRFLYNLKNWTMRYDWVRGQLPWKSYKPLLYECKVKHYCHGCDWVRQDGRMLWWCRRDAGDRACKGEGRDADKNVSKHDVSEESKKSDDYLCPACYVRTRSRFEALPEGYEDVKTLKDIVARKERLDETTTASTATKNQGLKTSAQVDE
jgi:hypothetical protein